MGKYGTKPKRTLDFSLPQFDWNRFKTEFFDHLDRTYGVEGEHFAVTYFRKEWLSKCYEPGTLSADDRAQAAIAKWLRAESRNAKTNHRVYIDDVTIANVNSDDLLRTAKRFIGTILGNVADIDWVIRSTNGASTRVRRSETASALKLEGKAHATSKAVPLWLDAIDGTILADQEGMVFPELVPGSVMFTVPKNSEIDRVACKEPEINQWLQRSIGLHIRSRLRRVGIDLRDQSRNQRAAHYGSRAGCDMATIDLSSASDLISRTLVNRLLSPDWYCLLDDLRVHCVRLPDGTLHEVEMFSSMGNGFTFELETLIFWGLCKAIQYHHGIRGKILVYGDDIICVARTARLFRHWAAWLGFKVNSKKSFHRGPFRESCGKHYHQGKDVTPFYTRKPIEHQSELILFLNRFREWSLRINPVNWQEDYKFWNQYAALVDRRFWGGRATERMDALVSPGKPRMTLTRVNRPIVGTRKGKDGQLVAYDYRPQLGSYFLGLADLDSRKWIDPNGFVSLEDELLPSSVLSKPGAWVVRRNKTWNFDIPMYFDEIDTSGT